jgi:hypothetical protein
VCFVVDELQLTELLVIWKFENFVFVHQKLQVGVFHPTTFPPGPMNIEYVAFYFTTKQDKSLRIVEDLFLEKP